MINNNCPYCHSIKIEKIEELISPYNHKKYELMNCKSCKLQYFTPLVFENDIYEAEIVHHEVYEEMHRGRTLFPPTAKKMLHIIKKLDIDIKDNFFFEIGAGDGINYLALNKICRIAPENYYVIELDSKSIEQCRKKGIINITNAMFDEVTVSRFDIAFDIIIMTEVLEHQTDPKKFIELIFRLLKQNGIVIITVPNREWFFNKQEEVDIPPHHFLKFNTKFFKENLSRHLYYVDTYARIGQYNRIKNIKPAALKITSSLNLTDRWWIFFAPLVPIIRVTLDFLSIIRGRGIIVLLKNNCNSSKECE